MVKSPVENSWIHATNGAIASGSTASLLTWVVEINWLGVIGAIVAIFGLAGNLYFQLRKDARETREHEARIAQIERGE